MQGWQWYIIENSEKYIYLPNWNWDVYRYIIFGHAILLTNDWCFYGEKIAAQEIITVKNNLHNLV
jgi:hypothetical protein